MRLHRLFASALLTLLVAAVAVAPARAAGNLAVRVDGSFTDGAGEGVFEGTLSVAKFERRGDRLVAVGSLDGTVADATGKQLGEIEDRAVTAVVDGSVAASCERAALEVRLEDADVAGVRLHLQPVEIEIAANAVPGHRLDAPLCELGKVVGPSADLGAVATQLGVVLTALE
jgi:hypothetical protein